MDDPLTYLEHDLGYRFLGDQNARLITLMREKVGVLQSLSRDFPRKILICEPDPLYFLAHFFAAYSQGFTIFLGNPAWGEQEQSQALHLFAAGYLAHPTHYEFYGDPHGASDPYRWILIPTGGSNGQIRFAIHTWDTLSHSVRGFQQHFQVDQVHSLCVLPLYHVSGLMQMMRCFLTGGCFRWESWKTLESDHIQRFDPTDFFLSLVPTQLHRLLDHPRLIPWLAQFKTIMVGGSPCWSDLLAKARSHQLPLALTYGMTETAAQICALKPEEFLQGNTSCGHILPHVQVALLPQEDPQDRADPVGQIVIQSTALALGYYPNLWENPTLVTGDIGRLDNQNQLYILGRKDDLIMTGGEKVFAHEIETVIRSVQGVADVCVMGLPDPEWGQKIGAAYVCMDATLSIEALDRVLQRRLSPYKRPKHWLRLDQLPRNGQGKINREKIRHWLMQEAAKDQSTAE